MNTRTTFLPVLTLLLALTMSACGAEKTDSGTDTGTDQAPSEPGRLVALDIPVASDAELALFFPEDALSMLLNYQSRFVNVQNAADLRAVYAEALSLDQMILGDIMAAADEGDDMAISQFAQADFPLPGLAPACVAECTEPAFQLSFEDWRAAARHVGSAEAEAFFQLVDDFYGYATIYDGDIQAWPSFFERTWDYGGYSLLGSGAHARLMSQIDALSASESPFSPYVDQLRTRLVNDATVQACIGPSATEAAAEVARLAEATSLSDGERIRLQERVSAFSSPASFGIEHSCASPDAMCTCMDG